MKGRRADQGVLGGEGFLRHWWICRGFRIGVGGVV